MLDRQRANNLATEPAMVLTIRKRLKGCPVGAILFTSFDVECHGVLTSRGDILRPMRRLAKA